MTDKEIIEEFKGKHLDSYKKAVLEIVKNNTKSLIEEDLFSLIKKPPLDSMDIIKGKLINLAKSKKIILETNAVDKLIESFRNSLKTDIMQLKKVREECLIEKIDEFNPTRETETIKITNKELTTVNKTFTKECKKRLTKSIEQVEATLDSIYTQDTKEMDIKEVNNQFIKYLKGSYQKQLFENISMKIMIKDRTLINGVNEQGERYLFTKGNSYLFNPKEIHHTK